MAGTSNADALTKVLALTGSFVVVEVVAGFLTGSLALISDAAHMLTDSAGLAIALVGIKMGEHPPMIAGLSVTGASTFCTDAPRPYWR